MIGSIPQSGGMDQGHILLQRQENERITGDTPRCLSRISSGLRTNC